MPLDDLPGKLIVPGRDQERDRYRRDYELRKRAGDPTGTPIDTGPATEVWIDASTMADHTALLHADAVTIANGVTRATATGPALDAWAKRAGTKRQDAVGASGAVTAAGSTGGFPIYADDEIRISGLRYRAKVGGTYFPGDLVDLVGFDTGPGTNQAAGVVGKWSATRPGLSPNATVAPQADGSGLSGGSDVENDGDLRARLDDLAANPPASGNDAEYRAVAQKTSGLSVQQPFTHDAIKGPGTIGLVFTLRPSQPGGNRIPSGTQIAEIAPAVTGSMPGNDSILVGTVVANPINVVLRIDWSRHVPGWADAAPWPTYSSSVMTQVKVGTTPTATAFTLTGCASAPPIGGTVAFFDKAGAAFREKRILTATSLGFGDYAVTCDVTGGASDTVYVPYPTQPVCPWSDSLTALAVPVLSYFDTLGPGEQIAPPFFDPGTRQRRMPASPAEWPSLVTNRVIAPLFKLAPIGDVTLQEPAVPYATPVGSPGILSYLTTLATLVAFPQ
jgi:uncharacterized phage protein gp47/JayE